jgi:hypothetical protein
MPHYTVCTNLPANSIVYDYFIKSNKVNVGFARFLAKHLTYDVTYNETSVKLVEQMIDNNVKQNIIEYFVRFKFNLHPNNFEIA